MAIASMSIDQREKVRKQADRRQLQALVLLVVGIMFAIIAVLNTGTESEGFVGSHMRAALIAEFASFLALLWSAVNAVVSYIEYQSIET
jgi:hypothetical protein